MQMAGGYDFSSFNVNVSIVYHKIVIALNNTFVNKTTKRFVPLSVCPCLSNDSYSCYMTNVYAVFPGQILQIKLILSPRWSGSSSTILAQKMMTVAYWTVTSCHRQYPIMAVTDTVTLSGQTVNL